MATIPTGGRPPPNDPKTIWLTFEVPGNASDKVSELTDKLKKAAERLANETFGNTLMGEKASSKDWYLG